MVKNFSPVKLFNSDVITIGDFNCTKTDLINAIKVFDFKNNRPVESVLLKSSFQKENLNLK